MRTKHCSLVGAIILLVLGGISVAGAIELGMVWSPETVGITDNGGGVAYTLAMSYDNASQFTQCCPSGAGCTFDVLFPDGSFETQGMPATLQSGTTTIQGVSDTYTGPNNLTVNLHATCYTSVPTQPPGTFRRLPDTHPEPSYSLFVSKQDTSVSTSKR